MHYTESQKDFFVNDFKVFSFVCYVNNLSNETYLLKLYLPASEEPNAEPMNYAIVVIGLTITFRSFEIEKLNSRGLKNSKDKMTRLHSTIKKNESYLVKVGSTNVILSTSASLDCAICITASIVSLVDVWF